MSAAQWVTNKGTAAGCCIFRLLASRGGGSRWSTIRAWYSCHRSILLPVADNRYPEMPAHSRSFRHHSLSQEESCQYSSISILPYSILLLVYDTCHAFFQVVVFLFPVAWAVLPINHDGDEVQIIVDVQRCFAVL